MVVQLTKVAEFILPCDKAQLIFRLRFKCAVTTGLCLVHANISEFEYRCISEFCTPFPAELKSDEMCEKLFPVESHSVDYIAAANTVRDDRARTVTKTVICQ